MGLENMRPGYGRCPPLLACGLFVMCVILVFNWWSLSSQNYDLLKQLEDLGEQLRISSDEQDLCARQKQASETKIKRVEDELAKLKVRVDEITTENEELRKTVETKEEELKTWQKNKEEVQGNADLCNTELESLKKLDLSKDGTISSLRDAKDRISTELKELKQTVEQLHSELSKAQGELSHLKTGKQSSISSVKTISAISLPAGSLRPITTLSAVSARSLGLSGMIYRPEIPILPQDPPDAYRPPPRFSVTQLKTRKEQPVTQFDDNIAIGGNHELEIEDNNDAKEEPDEADAGETNAENPDNAENADNADANQMGEGEPRMDMGEEDAAPA